ncbi:MAG: acetyl-CoA carboxylase carboxyltransferase subunit alpha [SAR86 cluster bacterium]|nr:acetyl-CoA carboxylase carboxyltransferase subunit alpha [SAR86 cluster bacterium]
MNGDYLDFEKPIEALESKLEELRNSPETDPEKISKEVNKLNDSIVLLTEKIFSNLSSWQSVQIARHAKRPHFLDYVTKICSHFDELHGDRRFGDDRAIIGGLATIGDHQVVLIGHEKGRSTEEKILHNFGMAQPEGYRKACRLMELAERFSLPVVTLIDTPGAYPGIESEERGQSEAIAYNLSVMSRLKTPIIVNIMGEGGSGGALAIAVGDKISMSEYSTYSVATPEACASIVWRDSDKAGDAAEAMQLSAQSILDLGLIDEIIKEPLGGAHRNPDYMANNLKGSIEKNILELRNIDISELTSKRYQRLMSYGSL